MEKFRKEATLPALVRANAERNPDQIAIVDADRRYSFGQFDEAVLGAVQAMMAFGVRPGDRIGVWAPNSVEWLIAAMGVLGAGGVLVPINNRLRGREVADILRRASASAVFTVNSFLGYEYASTLHQAAPDLRIPIVDLADSGDTGVLSWRSLRERGAAEVPVSKAVERIDSLPPGAVSDILFTSGTTGVPKGVVSTHEKTLHAAGEYTRILGLGPADTLLLVPPLGLMFGLKYIFLLGALAHAKVVMHSVFNADATMQIIAEQGITYLPGPPTLVQDVLDSPNRARYDLSSLQRILLAGTYVPPPLISRIRSERLVERIFVGYGLSEAAAVAMTRPDDEAEIATRTVGRSLPGVEIRIVDDEENTRAAGEPGEILVKAPWLMEGYYNDLQHTANAFTTEGWLRTGDSGWLDERGYLTIVGRKKDMYMVGGFNVYPAEVENCLMDHGAISQIAVVPMPHERLGEVGVAFVVPRSVENFNAEELLSWARERLANYKVPRLISVVEALPMNASAKVLRGELRARARDMASVAKGKAAP